jgi:hypothetical protein
MINIGTIYFSVGQKGVFLLPKFDLRKTYVKQGKPSYRLSEVVIL